MTSSFFKPLLLFHFTNFRNLGWWKKHSLRAGKVEILELLSPAFRKYYSRYTTAFPNKSQMNLLFAARGKYDETNFDNFSWEKYKDWSRIYQLDELVSLDGMLNEDL